MTFREQLFTEFRPYAELSGGQLQILEQHYELLARWNRKLNLTRIEDISEAVRFHYCESLFLGLQLTAGTHRIADVGSGAGFPGFPVAVLRPDLDMTLIESDQRKAVFLREATHSVRNIRVLAVRAEVCEERFDCVISRAVSPKEVLAAKLASSYALLVAASDAPPRSQIISVPWGERRVIARASNVSRET
ncbi:MAG TPA: 16S rRNA (guanine(527)-N(7))-methyltransferase RsmG [Bryobacteraceae bacterium]|nr:16S rRNA (guanine(527)-N(7))-methyltransferase RsmG [Bryobacteraceae bacterium]